MDTNPSCSSRKTTFSDLPFDTVIQIMLFTDPCEILALRKCCKKCYDASMQRVVWKIALEYVITSSNSIFRPSLPFHEMSIRDFEHAATSPYRLAARLWAQENDIIPLEPKAIRTVKFSGEIGNMLLIPGGRFLITQSEVGHRHTNIWDLGFGTNAMPVTLDESEPLASLQFSDYATHMAQATPDGSGILLLTELYELDFTMKVHEIHPTKAPALISEISLEPESELYETLAFQADHVVFHEESNIGVWNFRNNTWIMWTLSCDDVESAIVRDDEIVLLCSDSSLSVWKIPPLEPCHGNHIPLFEHQPLFSLPFFPPGHLLGSRSESSPCLTGTQKSHISLIGEDDRDTAVIKRFFPGSRYDQPTNEVLFTELHSFPAHSDGGHRAKFLEDLISGELPTGEVFSIWAEVGSYSCELMMNISTISATDGIPSKHNSVSLWLNGGGAHAFCPFSARLCVVKTGGIHVVDYLNPPPEEYNSVIFAERNLV